MPFCDSTHGTYYGACSPVTCRGFDEKDGEVLARSELELAQKTAQKRSDNIGFVVNKPIGAYHADQGLLTMHLVSLANSRGES